MIISVVLGLGLIGVVAWYAYILYETNNITEYHDKDVRLSRIRKSKKSCLNACINRSKILEQQDNISPIVDTVSLKTKINDLISVLKAPRATDMTVAYNKLKEIDAELLLVLSLSYQEASYE